MFKWRIVANLTNSLGYTASSLGNHEFDDGDGDLEYFCQAVPYPMLACNIDVSQQQPSQLNELIKPSITETILHRGVRHVIGIIGYVTPDTKELSNAGADVKFLDEIPPLQAEVNRMRNEGINTIIAVGHSGYKKDMEIAEKVTIKTDI